VLRLQPRRLLVGSGTWQTSVMLGRDVGDTAVSPRECVTCCLKHDSSDVGVTTTKQPAAVTVS